MAYYKNIPQIKYCACVEISRVCLSVKVFDVWTVEQCVTNYITLLFNCLHGKVVGYSIIVVFFNPMYSQVNDKGDLVSTYLLNVSTNLYKHTNLVRFRQKIIFSSILEHKQYIVSNVFNFSNLVFLSIELLPLHERMFLARFA